jgi:hypothetical protein
MSLQLADDGSEQSALKLVEDEETGALRLVAKAGSRVCVSPPL